MVIATIAYTLACSLTHRRPNTRPRSQRLDEQPQPVDTNGQLAVAAAKQHPARTDDVADVPLLRCGEDRAQQLRLQLQGDPAAAIGDPDGGALTGHFPR